MKLPSTLTVMGTNKMTILSFPVYKTEELKKVLFTDSEGSLSPSTCCFAGKIDSDIEPVKEYTVNYADIIVDHFRKVLAEANKEELMYAEDILMLGEGGNFYGHVVHKANLESALLSILKSLPSIEDKEILGNTRDGVFILETILRDMDWDSNTLYITN